MTLRPETEMIGRSEWMAAATGGAQLAAYRAILDRARDERATGQVLQALQTLRAGSLGNGLDGSGDAAVIAGSAHLRAMLSRLDAIAPRGEPGR